MTERLSHVLDMQELPKRVSGKPARAVRKAMVQHRSNSPGLHIPTLQPAFTYIVLNWTLRKLGDLDCQIIVVPGDLTKCQMD